MLASILNSLNQPGKRSYAAVQVNMPSASVVRAAVWSLRTSATARRFPMEGTMVLPASVWVKVEAAAVEVDRGLEVLPVAEAAGGVPDPLDLRIQALGGRVGDPVAEVGEDVREVRLEHPRLLDLGRQARVRRPEVPVAEELAGGPDVAVLPEVRGRLLERPGPGHLERAVA